MIPDWLIALVITLVGGWALAKYVDGGLAGVWVLLGLILTLVVAFGGARARRP